MRIFIKDRAQDRLCGSSYLFYFYPLALFGIDILKNCIIKIEIPMQ